MRTASLTVSEDVLFGPHTNVTNVWEFAVLLQWVEGLIRDNHEGTCENVSEVFRQSPREEELKGMTQGDTGSAATLCSSSALKTESSPLGSPTPVGDGAETVAVSVRFNLALGYGSIVRNSKHRHTSAS